MKQRVLTAVLGIPVVLLLLIVAPKPLAAGVMGVLMALGVYEVLFVTRIVKHPRMVLYSCAMAFSVAMWSCFGTSRGVAGILISVFWMLLFAELMSNHVKVDLQMVACCLFAGAVAPYCLSGIIRLLTLPTGRYLVIVPFVVAFSSDAGAYLVGIRLGRHKLAPVVSPKKTWEGLAGGLLSAVAGMMIYAALLALAFHQNVNFLSAVLCGVLGAGVGVFGDLSFSVIKRQAGIKDYGNLLPGHGGFYDRFDSMVLIAPVVEAILLLLPLVR